MLVEKTPKREAFFWDKVNKLAGKNSCWLWTGAKNAKGYGWITVMIDGRQRFFFVHKVSFEWENGDLQPGQIVRHTCDTPLCVRPSHLLAGTHLDNMKDMVDRNRHVGNREIDAATAVEIRIAKSKGESTNSLAQRHDLSTQHINAVCRGVYWPDAGGPIICRFTIPDSTIYGVISDAQRMSREAVAIKNQLSKAAVQQILSGKRLPKSPPADQYQLELLKGIGVSCQ